MTSKDRSKILFDFNPLRAPGGMEKDPTSGQEGDRFRHFGSNSLKRAVYLVGKIQK